MNPELKKRIVVALDYPLRMISDGFLPDDCDNQEHFDEGRADCLACRQSTMCEWLCLAREHADFGGMSGDRLAGILQCAIEYSVCMALERDHDPEHCGCHTCRWIHDANRLCAEWDREPVRVEAAHRTSRQPISNGSH